MNGCFTLILLNPSAHDAAFWFPFMACVLQIICCKGQLLTVRVYNPILMIMQSGDFPTFPRIYVDIFAMGYIPIFTTLPVSYQTHAIHIIKYHHHA